MGSQLAQRLLFTVADTLKSKLLCALRITIVEISCHTWGGCIVLCVFFLHSFFLFLFNGALSLEWTIACLESGQARKTLTVLFFQGRDTER